MDSHPALPLCRYADISATIEERCGAAPLRGRQQNGPTPFRDRDRPGEHKPSSHGKSTLRPHHALGGRDAIATSCISNEILLLPVVVPNRRQALRIDVLVLDSDQSANENTPSSRIAATIGGHPNISSVAARTEKPATELSLRSLAASTGSCSTPRPKLRALPRCLRFGFSAWLPP